MKLHGKTVTVTAETDTGKTTTVLKIIQAHPHAEFLSDDMVILSADGVMRNYPKPLTISSHTLQAVNRRALSRTRRLALIFQSRVHSKKGRGFALWLAMANVPILTINALVQILVPPPKYQVDELVPGCRIAETAMLKQVFLIERGADKLVEVSPSEAVAHLLRCTADAYTFPPFSSMAPSVVLEHMDHEGLTLRERITLQSAMIGVSMTRISSPNYGWAELIPQLLDETGVGTNTLQRAWSPDAQTAIEEAQL
jgi:hypothetical protein